MDLIFNIKKNLYAILIIIGLGFIVLVTSIFTGDFGLALMSFFGLLSCGSIMIFIIPLILKGELN